MSVTTKIEDSILHSKFEGKADGGAVKMSQIVSYKKIPLNLVPGALLRATGRALHYGATKYEANQWRRGLAWSQCISALIRHAVDFSDGFLFDSESGLSHLDHIGANLGFLAEFQEKPEYAFLNDLPTRELKYPDPEAVLQALAAAKAAKLAKL